MEIRDLTKLENDLCQFCGRCHKKDRGYGCESLKEIKANINQWLEEQGAVREIRNPNWPDCRNNKESWGKWIYEPLRIT